MIVIELYHNYFKYQAENHSELLHDDQSDNRVFAQIDIEESFGDFRTGAKEKDFIMRLIEPTTETSGEESLITGGFIIAHYHSDKNEGSEGYLNALKKSEKVTKDVIRRIIHDSREGHPLFNYSLDSKQDFSSQTVTHIGDGSYSGWRTVFSFNTFFDQCQNEEAYSDDGQTPHVL